MPPLPMVGGEAGEKFCSEWPTGCDCSASLWAFQAEYLMWWTRGRNLPPLVTTSPDGTPADQAGVIGQDGTRVLFGDGGIGERFRSGLRLSASLALDPSGCRYLEGRAWGLEDGAVTYAAASDGSPILTLPFFNAVLDEEDAFEIAVPGRTTAGRVRVSSHNDLFGADATLRELWWTDGCSQLYLLGGYQFTRLDDTLAVDVSTQVTDPQSALGVGTRLAFHDSFRTQNTFHGGHLGLMASASSGCWDVIAAGRIALGGMRQRAVVSGRRTTTTANGATQTNDFGFLALPSNIGDYERDRLAFIPQVDLTARYHLNDCWKLTLGYSFLYWNNVALGGNQIDRNLDLSQTTAPTGNQPPFFRFRSSDYWAMGLNFGAEYWW
ncbi:MAG: BBP7 family outer membrane beta-barrel protein [Pirellulaceae bacterium]|nr:BBP7 family outer membrane beta-barrel protein [Pirellulaceae bacterium]